MKILILINLTMILIYWMSNKFKNNVNVINANVGREVGNGVKIFLNQINDININLNAII